MYASKLASDENLGHQHMGAVYHRGRSQIASTSESHGGDLIIQRESIGRKGAEEVENAEANSKYQGGRKGKGQELHKTCVDGLLIKIAESEGLQVMRECSTNERSRQYAILYLFYSEG
ncbi:hypothetical protein B296_00018732 [Ensete ventricosum]|uniref:Uncharacterized protein n=1 Tax=Ensete ventricosum TaxID=4639 RepID=A0A426YHJ8_ENSVE|nr:hypothetical protein B296_00018732 [Ensete ventricosum]